VSDDGCVKEAAIIAALRSGPLPEDLAEHATLCAECSETAHFVRTAILPAIHRAARESEEAPLPDPGPIWWKAEMFARRDTARRAARPMALAERAAEFAAVAVAGVLLIWQGPLIREWLAGVWALVSGARTLVPVLQTHLLVIVSLALLPFILALSILGTSRSGD